MEVRTSTIVVMSILFAALNAANAAQFLKYRLVKYLQESPADGKAFCITQGTDSEDSTKAYANVQVTSEKGLQLFTFKQLHSATSGFTKSNLIGHGGFGLVYHGVLQNGRKIGVKVMDRAGNQSEEEFQVESLSRLRSMYVLALVTAQE
ncbi:hypothetical protein OROMI_018252 [Orobanche minor]